MPLTPLLRFYVPDLQPAAGDALLPAEEAHHLTRVMRLGVGSEVAVFDGRGLEFRANVVEAVRGRVRVVLLEAVTPVPEPHTAITLVQSVLKGDKMDDVVRDATMLGAVAVQPIASARTIAKRQSIERWRRIAIASAKQCRRAVVPRIAPVASVREWLLSDGAYGRRLMFVEPGVADAGEKRSLRAALGTSGSAVQAIVGPEGGWTPEERRAMVDAGCMPVTLGRLTLRADAVPIVALSILRYALDDV